MKANYKTMSIQVNVLSHCINPSILLPASIRKQINAISVPTKQKKNIIPMLMSIFVINMPNCDYCR